MTGAAVAGAGDVAAGADAPGGRAGVPVWTLLHSDPDWRWMPGRDDSPWYPTMRLFRQERPGDRESVIARVAEELGRLRDG